jgi:hypothetical protein
LFAVIFALLAGFFLFGLPRHRACLPLLIGATYMTLGQVIDVGPFHFTILRILVAIGVMRVLTRGERVHGGWIVLDKLIIAWGICAICNSVFHKDVSATLIGRLGLSYDWLGFYFLLRIFIRDANSLLAICRIVIIVLVPVAIEMIVEVVTGKNTFSFLGGVSELSEIRGGRVRAQGPFASSILAGTVGAVCLPLALVFWRKARRFALVGLFATGSMIVASGSSGPIVTVMSASLGLALWRFRQHMRLIRWCAVLGLVALNMVMKVPVYYLLARIDFTGHSTGYYRAALIDAAVRHLGDWWLWGTDYTRDWMPADNVVAWSEDHIDMTNEYLKMGVLGGLPLMLLFIGILICAFSAVGKALRSYAETPLEKQFVIWTIGSILFGHAATFFSVTYFDQSIVFLFLTLASIGSLQAVPVAESPEQHEAGSIPGSILIQGSSGDLQRRRVPVIAAATPSRRVRT